MVAPPVTSGQASALANGVTLRGGVLNIWNEPYYDHLNAKDPLTGIPVPEPGRVFFIDAVWSF